jgi:CRISPR/Cas system CSM-associated protein Csm3 (group 7 of RAMP superfamily)
MEHRIRNSTREIHGTYRYVPSDLYGAALTTYLAQEAFVPGSSVKGLLRRFVEFWSAIEPGGGPANVKLAKDHPTLAMRIARDPGIFEWAAETLGRTATVAEEAVAARRKTLREMAKVERRISRTQAETSRSLSRLTKRAAKA